MEILKTVVNYVLDLGAGVFMPVIMFLLGLIVRMPLKKNITAALTLGVAFTGISLVMGFMTDAISPAAQQLVKHTGIKLTALDVGWPPLSAISWAWPLAFLMFPYQIGINIWMLIFKWTDTLNVDMWNVWNKILTAVLIYFVSKNMILAFVGAGVQIILELKNGDLIQKSVEEATGIPGVTVTHPHGLVAMPMTYLDMVLDRIPGIKDVHLDAATMKKKVGIFGENHVMGFILGIFIAVLAGYNFKNTLVLGVQAATALLLLPMVAKLFMEALAPFSDATSTFVKKRFPGRNFIIGLDWPILAGKPEIWVVMILIIPIILLMAFVIPGNSILPFGGILMTGLAFTALLVTRGDMVKMLILSTLLIPVFLWVGSYLAPGITDLAKAVGGIHIPAGQLITRMGIEAPVFRYAIIEVSKVTMGSYIGIIFIFLYAAGRFGYRKIMLKRNKQLSAGTKQNSVEE